MATQTQMATEPTRDAVVEQKLQKLRELYADAPELGKVALQNGIADIAREFAALTGATGVQTAGRVGARQGKVSELTALLQIRERRSETTSRIAGTRGGQLPRRRRGRHASRYALRLPGKRHEAALRHRVRRRVGRLHRRLRDEDSRLRWTSSSATSRGGRVFASPRVKDWHRRHQITADAWYVANPNLTVAETRRLERVGKAVEEFLDKIS